MALMILQFTLPLSEYQVEHASEIDLIVYPIRSSFHCKQSLDTKQC